MFARWRDAGLILPTIMVLVMLPVLIGLGTWQWHRKIWKEDLIAKLDARSSADTISYAQALSNYVKTGDVEFTRVRVTGNFDYGQERHLYAPRTASQGWNVYTLLKPEGGLPPIFVNRGWVPDTLKDASKRSEGQVGGPVTVVGRVRMPEHAGWFTPANDYSGNRWYWRDLDGMAWGANGPPSELEFNTGKMQANAPFSLDAEAEPANPGGWPKGGTTPVHLSDPHLQYMITWYGFAVVLVVVFAVFARQRLTGTPIRPIRRPAN
jgi:surfeit locus 1 family protein